MAFLQGKPHGPECILWIYLPKDIQILLGIENVQGKLLKLYNCMHALMDVPRNSISRILSIPTIQQHPLDVCLFMIYDDNIQYAILF